MPASAVTEGGWAETSKPKAEAPIVPAPPEKKATPETTENAKTPPAAKTKPQPPAKHPAQHPDVLGTTSPPLTPELKHRIAEVQKRAKIREAQRKAAEAKLKQKPHGGIGAVGRDASKLHNAIGPVGGAETAPKSGGIGPVGGVATPTHKDIKTLNRASASTKTPADTKATAPKSKPAKKKTTAPASPSR